MFADNLGNNCSECLRILWRDTVADSCYPECYSCSHGVKIENGKRVLHDKSDKELAQGKQGTLEKKVETLNDSDKELE